MFPALPTELTTAIVRWASVPGWAPQEKMIDMAALVVREKPLLVAEIGVFGGRSLLPQAAALRHTGYGQMVGIDPYDRGACTEGKQPDTERIFWDQQDLETHYRQLAARIKDEGLDRWVHLLRKTAAAAVEHFALESINVLHIDGNHSEEMSTADVRLYLPRLAPGGWLWMDDSDWITVREALNLALNCCEMIKDYGRYCLLRKR